MPSIQQSFYLVNVQAISAIFLQNKVCYKLKVLLQRIQQFSDFTDKLNTVHASECGIAFSEIHLFPRNHLLEFHYIWHEDT